MSIADIGLLYENLPEVFKLTELQPDWGDDYFFIPVGSIDNFPDDIYSEDDGLAIYEPKITRPSIPGIFPGCPIQEWTSPYPPPDALAFYLPFHYFYPTSWGIYLIAEGVHELAKILKRENSNIRSKVALRASQLYLYAHEAYHHNVESFATKLEVTHRLPIYKKGLQEIYQEQDDIIKNGLYPEESLATAYGYLKTINAFKSDKIQMEAVSVALKGYIKKLPPAYSAGYDLLHEDKFKNEQYGFAEYCHFISLQKHEVDDKLWSCFPFAFSGIARITSRVKYLINRNNPIVMRKKLYLRYFRYRDIVKRLKKVFQIEHVRTAGHETWRTKDGKLIQIPHHPGELTKGTISSILRQCSPPKLSISALMQVKI